MRKFIVMLMVFIAITACRPLGQTGHICQPGEIDGDRDGYCQER